MDLLYMYNVTATSRHVNVNVSVNATNFSRAPSFAHAHGGNRADDVKFITMGVLGPFLEVSGLITSALSIVLLKLDRSIQASVRVILVALAIADILFLCGAIFCVQLDLYAALFNIASLQAIKGSFLQLSTCSIVNIAEMFRNWLTVLIGIERFIATNFPLTAKKLCSKRRIWIATIIIFFCSVLLRVPYTFRRWVRSSVNRTSVEEQLADLALTLHTNIDSFGLVIIPLVILTVVSALIIRNINVSHTLRSDMRAGARRRPQKASRKFSNSSDSCKGDTAAMHSCSRNSPVNGGASCNWIHARSSHLSPSTSNLLTSPTQRGYSHQRSASVHVQRRNQVVNMLLFIVLLFALFGIPQIVFVIMEYQRAPKVVRTYMVMVVWTCSMVYSNTNFFVYIAYMPKYRTMLKIVVCKFACTYQRWRKFHGKSTRKHSGNTSMYESTYVELISTPNKPADQLHCSVRYAASCGACTTR